MKPAIVLGIAGSPRSRCSGDTIEKIMDGIHDELSLNSVIEKIGRDRILSNSDICLLASMYGVRKYGLDFRTVNLKDIFHNDSLIITKKLENLIRSACGMVIASPVYFGDSTYLVNLFLTHMKQKSLLLGKVIGSVSVGAKRNGGQETTNVYINRKVHDAGAYVVGNGSPTSQYGGTAWAGEMGAIREDEFGVTTSIGTGRKVAEAASLLSTNGGSFAESPLRVAFWIMKDKKDTVVKEVSRLIEFANKNSSCDISWDIINFASMKFGACQACKTCPWFKNRDALYKCRIGKDDFASVYDRLVNTDAIIICGYHPHDANGLKDIYQKVIERTRCLRRDNFLLSNVLTASFSIEELPNNSLFSLKVMTYFLRQNTIIHPPFYTYIYKNERLSGPEFALPGFLDLVLRVRTSKKLMPDKQRALYLPVGHAM